jgi:hypothetical protein
VRLVGIEGGYEVATHVINAEEYQKRTELSDAPSSFVLFGASPEMALAKLENMLYYEGSSKFNG